MALNSTLRDALAAAHLRIFHAVRIEFINSGTTVNLIDGSGFVSFPVDGTATTFKGSDVTFGTLAGITSIQERVASEAPTVSVTIMPPSPAAFGEINAPKNQGSPVRIWWGVVDEMTGLVKGVPELLWSGRLDTVNGSAAQGTQVCEIVTVSAFDRLFAADEGECLSNTWHQNIWPGETGLAFNVQALTEPYWGADAPRPAVIATSPAQMTLQQKIIYGLSR